MKEKDFVEKDVEDIDVADGIEPDAAEPEVRKPEKIVRGVNTVDTPPPAPTMQQPARVPATFNPVFWGKVGETKSKNHVHKTYGHYVDGAGTFVKTVDFDKDGRIVATSVVFAPGVALDGFRLKKQK